MRPRSLSLNRRDVEALTAAISAHTDLVPDHEHSSESLPDRLAGVEPTRWAAVTLGFLTDSLTYGFAANVTNSAIATFLDDPQLAPLLTRCDPKRPGWQDTTPPSPEKDEHAQLQSARHVRGPRPAPLPSSTPARPATAAQVRYIRALQQQKAHHAPKPAHATATRRSSDE